jgi:hypothetical protein
MHIVGHDATTTSTMHHMSLPDDCGIVGGGWCALRAESGMCAPYHVVHRSQTDSNKELQNGRDIPPFASYTVHVSPAQKILISNKQKQK